MGAGKRFEIYLIKFIGFGIRIDNFPYEYDILIYLPFVSISIGLGKPYTYQ